MIEKQTVKKIKWRKTDNGLEFYSFKFDEYYENEGIITHKTMRYTPQ